MLVRVSVPLVGNGYWYLWRYRLIKKRMLVHWPTILRADSSNILNCSNKWCPLSKSAWWFIYYYEYSQHTGDVMEALWMRDMLLRKCHGLSSTILFKSWLYLNPSNRGLPRGFDFAISCCSIPRENVYAAREWLWIGKENMSNERRSLC